MYSSILISILKIIKGHDKSHFCRHRIKFILSTRKLCFIFTTVFRRSKKNMCIGKLQFVMKCIRCNYIWNADLRIRHLQNILYGNIACSISLSLAWFGVFVERRLYDSYFNFFKWKERNQIKLWWPLQFHITGLLK